MNGCSFGLFHHHSLRKLCGVEFRSIFIQAFLKESMCKERLFKVGKFLVINVIRKSEIS